jgi:hypothetical protein
MRRLKWNWGSFAKTLLLLGLVAHLPVIQSVDPRLIATSKLVGLNDCALVINEDSAGRFELASLYLVSADGKTVRRARFFGPLYYFFLRGTSGGAICHESDCANFTKGRD